MCLSNCQRQLQLLLLLGPSTRPQNHSTGPWNSLKRLRFCLKWVLNCTVIKKDAVPALPAGSPRTVTCSPVVSCTCNLSPHLSLQVFCLLPPEPEASISNTFITPPKRQRDGFQLTASSLSSSWDTYRCSGWISGPWCGDRDPRRRLEAWRSWKRWLWRWPCCLAC